MSTALNNLHVGKKTRIESIEPTGALYAKLLKKGTIQLYYRCERLEVNHYFLIGVYNRNAPVRSMTPTPEGYSLAAAKHHAKLLAIEHQTHVLEGRGSLYAARALTKAAELEATAREDSMREQTVLRLLNLYVDNLPHPSTQASNRSTVKQHLPAAFGALIAKDVTTEMWLHLFSDVTNKKSERTANRLRTVAVAAYNKCLKRSMQTPLAFLDFGVTVNPAQLVLPNVIGSAEDEINNLTVDELRTYYAAIKNLDGVKGATLRIHLLSGGLRPIQLLRLSKKLIKSNTFILRDFKGNGGLRKPRPYVTPITEHTRQDFDYLISQSSGELVFSSDGGNTQIDQKTTLDWARSAIDAAGTPIVDFNVKRIRSGCSTLLHEAGVPESIVARLHSNGGKSIQDRHYNAYAFDSEKALALEVLRRVLGGADIKSATYTIVGAEGCIAQRRGV